MKKAKIKNILAIGVTLAIALWVVIGTISTQDVLARPSPSSSPTPTPSSSPTPTPPACEDIWCHDTDGGFNITQKGIITYNGSIMFVDYCRNSSTLLEGVCLKRNDSMENKFNVTEVICPSACSNGACI